MNLFFSALLASITATTSVSAERDLQAIFSDTSTQLGTAADAASKLYERWYQDVPEIDYAPATNIFTLDFPTASSGNVDLHMDAVFYDSNCRWDGETANFVEHAVPPPKIHAVGTDDSLHALAVMTMNNALNPPAMKPQLKFVANTAELSKDALIYFSDTPSVGKAQMKLCVRTSLGYGTNVGTMPDGVTAVDTIAKNANGKWIRQADPAIPEPKYQEVNFIESLITINYDLSAGFTVEAFAVEPKERVETTAIKKNVYELRAYLCPLFDGEITLDSTNFADYQREMPVDLTDAYEPDPTGGYEHTMGGKREYPNAAAFNQGGLATVCVMPDPVAWKDGIRMNGIDTFSWSRPTPLPGQNQVGIENGQPSGNLLTSYITENCENEKPFCHFSSIFFADFFRSRGFIQGTGSATIQFATRRRLGEGEVRKLQEDESISEFDMTIAVDVTNDGPGALKTAGGRSFGFTILASVVAVASAALLA